ncbi:AAA family ATPase [Enorma massiliensis]|uniref:AAA family ATPase n=1 Tax=Enorma massiliensis TaxID=1472761 RepID=UPI003AF1A750
MVASSPSRLLPPGQSIDAATLMTLEFTAGRAIIPGLLYVGLTILASRPKDGKSFMAIKLGLCLALGLSFLGLPAVQCGVLIFALEDTLDRIRDRLAGLPYEKNGLLHFATSSDGLPSALFHELDAQLAAFPDIRVVVIDTLQKIRHRTGDVGYNADYEDLGRLKEYADERGIAILLLHHTRKAEAGTEYDRISGTSGITGVADTMMVLTRTGEDTKLLVKGREFEEHEFNVAFNDGDWQLADEATLRKRAVRALPDGTRRVIDLMGVCDGWTGTCKELLETIKIPNITERALSQQLRDGTETLSKMGISIAWSRTNRGSVVSLTKRNDSPDE